MPKHKLRIHVPGRALNTQMSKSLRGFNLPQDKPQRPFSLIKCVMLINRAN